MKPKFRKKAVDRRGSKTISKPSAKQTDPESRTTLTNQAPSAKKRFHMNIRLFMNTKSGNWYLHTKSDFNHNFHPKLQQDASLLSKDDLSDDQLDFLKIMYENGISQTTIANAMTNAVNKEGITGEFLGSTIKNITTGMQQAMDEIAGIDSSWSIAQKTIQKLNE